MIVLVTGDRNWRDEGLLWVVLNTIHAETPITLLVEGCARGADETAGDWAFHHGVWNAHHPARWQRDGLAAGPIRNQEMLDDHAIELVVAFHDDLLGSRGTKDMVRRAQRAGIPVRLFTTHGEVTKVPEL